MGLRDFTLVFNGSLIKSEVKFDKSSRRKDRPMQGQSPYLVNLGLFYNHSDWAASLQYNRIGKRLIGVGRSLGTTADQTVTIPTRTKCRATCSTFLWLAVLAVSN